MLSIKPNFARTGSCFERDIPHLQELIEESREKDIKTDPFPIEVVKTIAKYVETHPNPFGAAEWKKYFGVDVGPEPEFKEGFEAWWHGPDPIDPSKFVCETHLPPILAPQFLRNEQGIFPRTLDTLEKMGLGFSTLGFSTSGVGRNFQNIKNVVADPSHWLVMRKDVLARKSRYPDTDTHIPWEHQKQYMKDLNEQTAAGYEAEPSMIDLATVIFARYVWTGEKHLGSGLDGEEGRATLSYCSEYMQCLNPHCSFPFIFGGLHESNGKIRTFVDCGRDNSSATGIAALRKF
ncbi:MAG TPA: hypothetical protein VLE95_09080 [Chlamydiales bacterium]|nr:hypothetical protein [Chlamydiales bacterium]